MRKVYKLKQYDLHSEVKMMDQGDTREEHLFWEILGLMENKCSNKLYMSYVKV